MPYNLAVFIGDRDRSCFIHWCAAPALTPSVAGPRIAACWTICPAQDIAGEARPPGVSRLGNSLPNSHDWRATELTPRLALYTIVDSSRGPS
jgi:hypothetical protein